MTSEQFLYNVYTTSTGDPVIVVEKEEDYDAEQVAQDQKKLRQRGFQGETMVFTKRYPIAISTLKFLLGFWPRGAAYLTRCTVDEFCDYYADYFYLSQKKAEELRQNIGLALSQESYGISASSMNARDQQFYLNYIWPYHDYTTRLSAKKTVELPDKIGYSAMTVMGITLGQVFWQQVFRHDDLKLYEMRPCWLALIDYLGEKRVQLLLPEYLGAELAPYIRVEKFPEGVMTYRFSSLPWSYFNDFLQVCEEFKLRPTGSEPWKNIESYLVMSRIPFKYGCHLDTWRAGTASITHPFIDEEIPALLLNNTRDHRQLYFLSTDQLSAKRQFPLDTATYVESYRERFGDENYGFWESPQEEEFKFLNQNYRAEELLICPTVEISGVGPETKLTLHRDFYSKSWRDQPERCLLDGSYRHDLVAQVGSLEVRHTVDGEIITFL